MISEQPLTTLFDNGLPDASGQLGRMAVVVAHPDDEGLWFSSVLARMDTIVICLMGSKSRPQLGAARRASLENYLLSGLISLGIDQADCFGGADWRHPQLNTLGIALPNRPDAEERYHDNYKTLRHRLRPYLVGIDHVFTHAPWGEYGHEEHIQIHRVVSDLQQELGFKLWYPTYCSSKTRLLLRQVRISSAAKILTLHTDRDLAARLKANYQSNNCWTWYPDWYGWDEESFIGQSPEEYQRSASGIRLPARLLNHILQPEEKPGLWERLTGRHRGVDSTLQRG